ncbi:MAG: glycoside hydrolase family 3 C-terminal domain-containing protein [Prevotellaceae bacterium]|nr:glycoside hydrolase family 3 C-terminal domain-containing protein [Prevotellaceae bacterium]
MKKIILALCLVACCCPAYSQAAPDFRNPDKDTETRVNDVIAHMTLDEKIALLAGYNDFFFHPCARLDIPAFKMGDGPLGVASWGLFGRATAFPAALAQASSWNRDLMQRLGAMYAREWRARGVHFLLSPGVNIYRASKSARNFEYFGEDPYLASAMIVPFIKAVQEGGVIATVKHFAGNEQEFDRYRVSSEIGERALREIYLPPFKAAVQEAGVWAVMTSYNPLNGTYTTQNKFLINILKKEWGFKGLLMSDWACTYNAIEAANNGLDMEMGSMVAFKYDVLKPLIDAGKVTEATLDEKVRRIYRACIAMGFFDRDQQSGEPLYNVDANKLALEAAREGITLLKNERNLLPLQPVGIKTIAVIGPTANPMLITDRAFQGPHRIVYGGGGSSKVNPWYIVSDLDGIKNQFAECKVVYAEGISNDFKYNLFRTSRFVTDEGKPGLKARYSVNVQEAQKVDGQVNFEWDMWAPEMQGGKELSVRWEGFIEVSETGDLLLFVDAQGGYRLSVDDRTVLDAYSAPSFDNRNISLAVNKGERKKVTLEYRSNGAAPAEIRLGYTYRSRIDFSEALAVARQADAVIFCGGLDGEIEKEGRDRPFDLPFGQDELIKELAKVNPNLCVVIHAGGGVNMSTWIDHVPAVLHALYPGQEGGAALAEILSGAVNPSAKLPYTIEKRWEDSPAYGGYDETRGERKVYYHEGIFVGYRGYDKKGITPLFPFGHGLSYTTFEYSDLNIEAKDRNRVRVRFSITNTGTRAGAEVAQLYIRDIKSTEERPEKELKGFEKLWLDAGETKTVEILLAEDAFTYFSEKRNKWVFEKGEFDFLVGKSSQDIILHKTVSLK